MPTKKIDDPFPPGSDMPDGLSAPARRALMGSGITMLSQLTTRTEGDLLALHGFGRSGLVVLRAALAARGLSFKS